jgi:hypothetical protein
VSHGSKAQRVRVSLVVQMNSIQNEVVFRLKQVFLDVDVWLMGGLSILGCAIIWLTIDRTQNLYTISQVAFFLAFAVNHPHFLSSYLILYHDQKSEMFKRKTFLWAGVVVPVLLLLLISVALLRRDTFTLGWVIHAMFLLVAWHYIKQVFGCLVVTSARKKHYFTKKFRQVLLIHLYSAGAVSWLTSQVAVPGVAGGSFDFYGITYSRLNLPPVLLWLAYGVAGLTLIQMLVLARQRYRSDKSMPAVPGIAALVALYVWYIPLAMHPAFAYFIPAFHSLQYLAFVHCLKRNQSKELVSAGAVSGETNKQNTYWGFAAWSLLLGAAAFEFVPKFLDSQGWISGVGTAPFLASFLLFINIHHYFIDNVIWRADVPSVKKYLLTAN